MTSSKTFDNAFCPIPLPHNERIVLGHGSGGKMTHDLIRKIFMPYFDNPLLRTGDDSAVFTIPPDTKIALTTDSHVVSPLFFPGGDIGKLAVCGTVNDLAVMGATPLYLTAGFILEEGLEVEILQRILMSMRNSALEAGVLIVAGDTKVVQKGRGDGVYINTSGVGFIPNSSPQVSGSNARPGDAVIISGPIGNHGIAVISARGDLGVTIDIQSDVAPLNDLIKTILAVSNNIHVLRDPTRGGLATTLTEIAAQSQVGITLKEINIPILNPVRAACEMLGFDPLYIANEGKVIVIAAQEDADKILHTMTNHPLGVGAAVIGKVAEAPVGRVLVQTEFGSNRLVDMLSGEILPRIC